MKLTIKQIYDLAIRLGKDADLRGSARVAKKLKRIRQKYDELKPSEKEDFDMERLINPYSDTRILCGNKNDKVKRVLAGIDIDSAEILLSRQLSKINDIQLVISHHPRGIALARLDDVMGLQVDLLEDLGIPVNVAENLIKKRMAEVFRGISGINHYQVIDTANLLSENLMCVHTAADNLVANFLKKLFDKNKPETVGEIIELLKTIPEYKQASKIGTGPAIFTGNKENRCGKIAFTEVTGGTSGHKNIYEKLSQAGVGTIIGMHMSEEYKAEAEKNHINVVIAGHISSDSIGMNLFLDELEKKGIEVIPCSGLIRVKRFKK
jgi:putative NIF3 family GTP cyclohydrolase 1 type 2